MWRNVKSSKVTKLITGFDGSPLFLPFFSSFSSWFPCFKHTAQNTPFGTIFSSISNYQRSIWIKRKKGESRTDDHIRYFVARCMLCAPELVLRLMCASSASKVLHKIHQTGILCLAHTHTHPNTRSVANVVNAFDSCWYNTATWFIFWHYLRIKFTFSPFCHWSFHRKNVKCAHRTAPGIPNHRHIIWTNCCSHFFSTSITVFYILIILLILLYSSKIYRYFITMEANTRKCQKASYFLVFLFLQFLCQIWALHFLPVECSIILYSRLISQCIISGHRHNENTHIILIHMLDW